MPDTKRIAVIGDGGWGTALASVAARNGHVALIWSPFPENVEAFSKAAENTTFLPGVQLSESIGWTSHAEDLADADLTIIAVPSQFYRDTLLQFQDVIPSSARVVSVSKGLERDTHKRLTEIAEEILAVDSVGVLSGPSHAEEVARGIPTAVTTACQDPDTASSVQALMSDKCFRIYTSDDKAGVELGGALKNVIAVAVGVSDGMGFGDNTRAALITRGLAEITRLGVALGAQERTFAGLSGMGDLIVTCTSQHSRNRAVGERIGRGESIQEILSSTKKVAEGVWNSVSAQQSAREFGIDVPITDEVCAMVSAGKSPAQAVESLLTRDMRAE
jgi:glycerol-3-phosphate dehydrogenase (NAD(P)+)